MPKSIVFPRDGKTIEGHPLGISKIIQGDLREKTWEDVSGNKYSSQNDAGFILFDKIEQRNRPWFILAYESGARIVD